MNVTERINLACGRNDRWQPSRPPDSIVNERLIRYLAYEELKELFPRLAKYKTSKV